MSDSLKRILIDLAIGAVFVVICVFWFEPFAAQTKTDTLRILSDCFFVPGAMLLATAGLTFTGNAGVWDGLGFSVKTFIARMKPHYEQERMTFAEYRERREKKKTTSPFSAFLSGLVYLALAIVFMVGYNMSL